MDMEKTIVMLMEHKWTSLYSIDKSLYDDIINDFGSLQGMYDECCKNNNLAKDYYDKILKSEHIDADGVHIY